MPVHAAAEEALGELASRAAALAAASGGNLLECFAAVPDPRDPRRIRHSPPCLLPVCTAAARRGGVAGMGVEGKGVGGGAGEDGLIPYLLAAVTHGAGTVLAERLIGPKTNEVPEFAPLLRGLNECYCLTGHVVTADAGHTVKAHARLICEELLAHYVFTVKLNTKKLWEELDALDWRKVPVQHETSAKR